MCENLTQNVAVCELNSHATFDGIQASLAKQPAGLLLHVGDLAYAIGYEWVRCGWIVKKKNNNNDNNNPCQHYRLDMGPVYEHD